MIPPEKYWWERIQTELTGFARRGSRLAVRPVLARMPDRTDLNGEGRGHGGSRRDKHS